MRLSDADRTTAMAALGRALSEGRLDMVEYDERCKKAAAAKVPAQLDELFADLPSSLFTAAQAGATDTSRALERTYTQREVESLHRVGARPRTGIMVLTCIIALLGNIAVDEAGAGDFASAAVVMIVPVVFTLLYILKVGPTSWYAPSPRQIERERMRQLRVAHRERAAQLRAARMEQRAELGNQAYNFARKKLPQSKSHDAQ